MKHTHPTAWAPLALAAATDGGAKLARVHDHPHDLALGTHRYEIELACTDDFPEAKLEHIGALGYLTCLGSYRCVEA